MSHTAEQAKFWRWSSPSLHHAAQPAGLDLLHAHYVTHSFSRHIHDTFAIGVIVQGAEGFAYRGSTHVAPAGSVVLINPGEVHTGYAAVESGWTYRMLYPDVCILEHASREAMGHSVTMPYFPQPIVQDELTRGLLWRLHLALEQEAPLLELDSRMLWTMAQLIMRHGDTRAEPSTLPSEPSAVQRVREYLDAQFAENPSLDELAAIANLSPFHLLRCFRRQVGLPPHEYLTQRRLTQARRLLRLGHPILEVAHVTGFADQSHLTRQFKRVVGVTPGCYQRQSKIVQDSHATLS